MRNRGKRRRVKHKQNNNIPAVIFNENARTVEKLIDKAEKTREAHFLLAKKYSFRSRLLHSLILIGSSVVAILTFADYSVFLPMFNQLNRNNFTLFVGTLASMVFIFSVLDEFLGWKEKAHSYEEAGKVLTSFIRTGHRIKARVNISDNDLHSVTEHYNMIHEQLPTIPNRIFLKAKREHLIKVEISKTLDSNPFLTIRKIKKLKSSKGGLVCGWFKCCRR